MQPRPRRRQFTQVLDDLGSDPLPRQQRRDAGRIAGDRFARDATDRLMHGNRLAVAKKRLAGCNRGLVVATRGRPRHHWRVVGLDRRGDPPDRLAEIVGDLLERLHRLRQPEHQNHRRVGRELEWMSNEARSAEATW